MKKTLHYLSLSLFTLLVISISTNEATAQKEKCRFDQILQQQLQDETFRSRHAEMERYIQQFARQSTQNRSAATVNIPCVVHIIHTGQAPGTQDVDNSDDGTDGANPNDAQINSAITNMTDAFKHTGPYAGLNVYAASLDVNFVLAKTAPDGSASTGIVRHDVSGESWGAQFANEGMDAGLSPGVPQATITAGRFWPPMDYMNIWIVHEVENSTETLGFASFPNANTGSTDGLTMLASAFGYDPENDDGYLLNPVTNLNGTANHETGHYLNLYHTFTGDDNGVTCPADATCGTDSDCCADTPPHKRTSGCPSDNSTGNECTSGPNIYIHNFMDYADDACFHGFSENQKTRMEAALGGPRATLANSIGDDVPASTYPVSVSAPAVTNPDQTMGIYDVTLNGTTFKSWSAYHDGGYMNRVASASRVNLLFGTMYTMTIKVGVGNTSNDELVNVYIDYDNDGAFTQAGDEVYVTPAGSGKKNGDTFTFSFTTPSSSVPPGASIPPADQGLRMRIISDFDNGSTPLSATSTPSQGGQIEDYAIELSEIPLPISLVNFSATPNHSAVILEWQTKTEIDNAGFEIQRMEEGDGLHFQKIGWIGGRGTSTQTNTYFYTDTKVQKGKTYYYRLKQIDFDEDFQFSNIASARISGGSAQLDIFPNPASNQIRVTLNEELNENITVNIFTATGRLMLSEKINTEESRSVDFDLSTFPDGVYLIQATGKFGPHTKKVILNKR